MILVAGCASGGGKLRHQSYRHTNQPAGTRGRREQEEQEEQEEGAAAASPALFIIGGCGWGEPVAREPGQGREAGGAGQGHS